ncbi:MAG: hypothetical protein IT428_05540 [Planctomycetaceae bacterium]|nr:hypothetical protein [Planctomycetaceae bacterium]
MRHRLIPSTVPGQGRGGIIRATLTALAGMVLLVGCSKPEGPVRVAVEGKVTVDSQPLKTGTIRFIPAPPLQGPAATAEIKDGAYKIPKDLGPMIGEQRVEIDGDMNPGFAIDDEEAYAKAHKEKRGKVIPPNPIPAKYNRQSTLKARVDVDTRELPPFSLESTQKKG